MTSSAPPRHGWADEARDLIRALGGAAIIGIPLLYTQETYDWASNAPTGLLTGYLALALIANVGYNLVSGFRQGGGLVQASRDAVQSLGLGIVLGALLLWLLGIVDNGTPATDIAAKIATEAVPLSLGVSVANTQFGGSRDQGQGEDDTPPDDSTSPWKATLRDAGITLAGAIVIAASIAPTEEVMRLATALTDFRLGLLMLFSLLLSYGMIFEAGFAGQKARRSSPGLLQSPLGETLLSYTLSLAVSLALVYVFHGVSLWHSPRTTLACVVVLALPATVGGAAGRLVI